jgi:hypothetical protein
MRRGWQSRCANEALSRSTIRQSDRGDIYRRMFSVLDERYRVREIKLQVFAAPVDSVFRQYAGLHMANFNAEPRELIQSGQHMASVRRHLERNVQTCAAL